MRCLKANITPGGCGASALPLLYHERSARTAQKQHAAMSADPGIVNTHAQTIRRAKPHLTAWTRRTDPTPTIAPVMVCVVLTGIPPWTAMNRDIAPAVSAAKPATGVSLVKRAPIVCTILQ